MLEVMSGAGDLFENMAGPGAFAPRPEDRPLTKFELRGKRLGHAVRDLVFRRREGPI
jgi:tRNA (guanine-N7-)-methyltransferase